MIEFFAQGIPKPGGSKKYVGQHNGHALIVDMSKNKGWRKIVAATAKASFTGPLLTDALSVTFAFVVRRPLGHWRASGALKAWAEPLCPVVRPDVLKLTRSTEDALTGIIWKDDAQIVDEHISKRYQRAMGEKTGVLIRVSIYQPTQ